MDVEFADPTYTVKELKAKIARIGLKLPPRRIQTMFGSGKDGRLVKKDYEKILKMYKNKAVLELIKESTTYTVKELKAKIAEMGFNKKDYILIVYISLALRIVSLRRRARRFGMSDFDSKFQGLRERDLSPSRA